MSGAAPPYITKGATISPCQRYRYRLWREWRLAPDTDRSKTWNWWYEGSGKIKVVDGAGSHIGEPKAVVFVMLNPSTADGDHDDPTIRRCVGFAKAWGYERLEVVNLFAWRATNPRVILGLDGRNEDAVGLGNQAHIERAVERAGMIVCAWGAHGGHLGQDETTLGWLAHKEPLIHALKLTAERFPCHPLYLPASLTPVPYRGRKYRSAA